MRNFQKSEQIEISTKNSLWESTLRVECRKQKVIVQFNVRRSAYPFPSAFAIVTYKPRLKYNRKNELTNLKLGENVDHMGVKHLTQKIQGQRHKVKLLSPFVCAIALISH